MLLQSLYGPKPNVPVAENTKAVTTLGEEAPADASDATNADQTSDDGTSPAANAESQNAAIDGTEQAAEENPDSTSDDAQEDKTPTPPPAPAFVKLGSLNPDGSDRFLVTVNQNGGTLHQVELNFRDTKKQICFRDLATKGGYLGSFNTVEASGKITVVAVGRHTPAANAGLQTDDIVESVNDKPIVGREALENWLHENTKAGDTIQVGIERGGAKQTLTATLTEKPIAIIRPESGLVDKNFDYPESFIFSLIKPAEVHERWPDLDQTMREGRWELTENTTDQLVELKFDIPQANLEKHKLSGPITVLKRYRLPKLQQIDVHNLNSRTFHIELEIEIQNGGTADVNLAYELGGPTEVSAETWWYANKIHGRQAAVFYTAGARDVIGATAENEDIFWGRPEIVEGAKSSSPTPKAICDRLSANPDDRRLKFAGVDSHYFNVSLIPQVPEGEFLTVDSVEAYPVNRFGKLPELPKNASLNKLIACSFQMVTSTTIPASSTYKQSFDIFCGPKDIDLLEHYELANARKFGWFGWCSIALLQVLHFFYWITFKTSYGLAIILLTVLVRCMMIPFSRKAALNAQMMQHLSPQIKEINEKYGTDLEKKSAATQALYKKYKFNPLSGCFVMVFQLPVFYGLYKALNVDIALRDQPFIPGLQWCSNLAAPDQFLNWQSWMPDWIANETGYLGPYLNILPIITMFLFILQQKLFTPPATDDQQKMMQKMMMFMMLFMGFMFFKVPSGLCLYFITSSLWAVIERKLLPKPKLDTDRFADIDDNGPKPTKPNRAEKRKQALTMKEEAERMSKAEELKRTKADRKKRLKKRGQ